MDRPEADPAELRRSLRFIERVNRRLGYSRATIKHLERFSRTWRNGERIEIVDLATGSADIPRAILSWAEMCGFDVRVTALDLHPTTIRLADDDDQRHDPRLRLVRADALCPPFADRSFDYALTAMFLHHLDDDAIVAVLRQMDRLSRRGVIVADLFRNRRAYFWIRILTMFSGPMVRHDAAASVAQAFSADEILALRDAAGLAYTKFYRHFGHRWVLAGHRRDLPVEEFAVNDR